MDNPKQLHRKLKEKHPHVDHNWWPTRSQNKRLEVILGCILTQNTQWENVEKALNNLHGKELINQRELAEKDVKEEIKPSGFYNQKHARIKRMIQFLEENPIEKLLERNTKQLREELLDIKGIGKETADSILLYALDKPSFVIDTYTKRVLKHHGFKADKNYDSLKEWFEKQLPKSVNLYKEYHALFVEEGKQIS